MSLEDGLVLQIHAGAWRNHNPSLWARFGPDMGADIPQATDYVGDAQTAAGPIRKRPGA